MKIKLTTPETKLISFWDIYGKELEVKDTKTVQFASGPKKYYIAEFEGKDYEVPEDMVDNSIPNNYEGKSPEQVWNAWTQDQRTHFIKDHFDEINRAGNSEGIQYTTWISASNLLEKQSYGELSRPVKQILQNHITSGQYKFGGKVEESELDEINSLLGMTVEVWPLGSNEPIVYTIKGIHVTPPQFDKRFVALSFYGDEWPSQFNDHDVIPLEKLGDFLAGEEIKLYDSNNEPYMINIGGIAAKGKKVDGYYIGVFEPDGKMNMAFKLVDLKDTAMDKIIDYALQNNYTVKKITEQEYNNSPSYFDRESGKFKAAKGTKINEMKNNYYYLKIGNVIKEPKYNNSLEIVAFERDKIKVKEISKILKNTTADFIDYETFVSYMNFGDITIEGCTYETDRDKLLLKMEIDNIQSSFKEVEFKEKAEKLLTETSQVKKEANELLSKLESKTKGFEDTLAGVEALNTKGSAYDRKLNEFLNRFPNDAESWGQATDEIREMASDVRAAYNEGVLDVIEGDSGYVEGLNFREFAKPSQWNTEAKKFILHYWVLLPDRIKKQYFFDDNRWFGKQEEAAKGKMVGGKEAKIISDYQEAVNKYYTKGLKDFKGDKDMIDMYETDKSNHQDVIDLMKMGNWKQAYKSWQMQDTASREVITKSAYNLLNEKNGFAAKGTKVKAKKKGANPKRGKTTLSERNYMKKFKKEFEALKDAYPDSTFKQLIEKHKSAGNKKADSAQYDAKGALKLTQDENDAWENAFNDELDNGSSDSKADKEAAKAIIAEFPRLKDLLKGKTKISTEIAD